MPVLVSIIIPTFNRAHLIGETLNSVINQTYPNWECIVIDDGSTDYTQELLRFYCDLDARIRYYHRPKDRPKGANACRNYGFEISRGKYINWFDSDDLMDSILLRRKVDLLESNLNWDYCLSSMSSFYAEGRENEILRTTKVEFNEVFRDYVMGKFSAGTPSVLWRRKIFIKQDRLFDENISNSQDLEFYSRLFLENKNVGVLNTPLIYFRVHDKSVSEEFFSCTGNHLNSFLEVKRRIIEMAGKDAEIIKSNLLRVLAVFRTCLANKDYKGCQQCLLFIKENNKKSSQISKIDFLRIRLFYNIFKMLGRGDTRYRNLLKI